MDNGKRGLRMESVVLEAESHEFRHPDVDHLAAAFAGAETPALNGVDRGLIQFGMTGALEDGGIDHVALGIADETDVHRTLDAGASHFKRVLWRGLQAGFGRLVQIGKVEDLRTIKAAVLDG